MADTNVPSVDMSSGRSTPCRDDLEYGSTGDSEGVGSVLGGTYALGKSKNKARDAGEDGRPAPDSKLYIDR